MSSMVEHYVSELKSVEADYVPGAETQAGLHGKTFIALIGPMAVGKTTVIQAVCDMDANFSGSNGFTTRPRRPDESENAYRFRPHDEKTLSSIFDQIVTGELVQYVVHPTTGYIYGSDSTDYRQRFYVGAWLPSDFAKMASLPFDKAIAVSLVCSPDEWQKRLNRRAAHTSRAEIDKRLKEAVTNLTWSLEHDTVWIKTFHDKPSQTASKVIDLAYGHYAETTNYRRTGEKLLPYIKNLINS